METSNKVHEAIDGFKLPGELKECIRYGSGHINDTYRLTYETPQGTKRYILQRMSKSIFKETGRTDGECQRRYCLAS